MANARLRTALQFTATVTAAAVGWLAIYWFLLLPILVIIYRDESLAILNHIIQGQGIHSLDYYLDKTWRTTWITLPCVILIVLVAFAWDRRSEILFLAVLLLAT